MALRLPRCQTTSTIISTPNLLMKHCLPTGSSSSNIRVGNAQVRCNNCGKKTLIKIVRKGPNFGMKFYGCPMWPDTQCDFFKWVNEHTDVEEYQFKLLEKDTIICELEVEQNFRDEKIKKLQLKKAKLEEELKEMKKEVIEMRIELEKLSRTGKTLFLAMFVSLMLFVVVFFFK
ncbi:uncharacterized protein LOC110705796 [Chenopodium quinoa]|uniref:uncharacterized protein LOC110705796 n=1 Tax=Chenopodium quinoa TaxID=63459 RepID=UPI000B790BBB|nr:uncharacterized protein LOC110705796 [Chenopodium quinoa]